MAYVHVIVEDDGEEAAALRIKIEDLADVAEWRGLRPVDLALECLYTGLLETRRARDREYEEAWR